MESIINLIEVEKQLIDLFVTEKKWVSIYNSYYYNYPNIQYKWPTAIHYNIDFNQNKLHGSLYDCKITLEIFKKMIENKLVII